MPSPPRLREPWQRKFQGLMPFRVREILLVSSDYDAFVLEEDGPLTERLFTGYSELNLSSAPRITHVSTAEDALDLLAEQRFDLVITVLRIEDSDAASLSEKIKERHHGVPVVLLLFDEVEVGTFEGGVIPDSIDRAILWSGSARTLLAAIKLVEDMRNVEHDARVAGIQVILVVEDQIRAYSMFLSMLYPEMMSQSQSLIQEGFNDLQRLLRIRARPKILLANDWDEAQQCLDTYGDRMMALLTDVRFPRGGEEDETAGIDLARQARAALPDLPVLFLSTEEGVEKEAAVLGAWSVPKTSPAFATRIRRFLKEALGFGAFVFFMPDGTELARARNVYEMEQLLARMPIESIEHHASRHDFSVWLRARSMFELAAELRPKSVSEFESLEDVRVFIVDALRKARETHQEGSVTDSVAPPAEAENRFVRVGRGSMGGKARGVAYVNSLIVRYGLLEHFDGLQIRIPKSVSLGTEAFEKFLDENAGLANESSPDLDRWLHADFNDRLSRALESACRMLKGPLAVRSSSVQEDSRFQPFAGVYATYMLPNNHPHPHIRHRELLKAIKAVYASVYSREARTYMAGTPHLLEDQPMAVVVQQVVGQRYGDRFYPLISGVAQSRNFYPLGAQRPEDGVAVLALGLGETVVRGGTALRFSPRTPRVLPQFPDDRARMRLSQSRFYAIDMAESEMDFLGGHTVSLVECDLDTAEEDGTLQSVGSVYSTADDVIRDTFNEDGPRVVTFNNILRYNEFPLADALSTLLEVLREGMGSEVEVEIAVDSAGWEGRDPRLYVLQVRPMPPYDTAPLGVSLDDVPPERVLVTTNRALGHGRIDDVLDVVYVTSSDLVSRQTRVAAREVRSLTEELHRDGRPYLLIGPGRWGTSDPALGIPVQWQDIAGAKAIVETPIAERYVEPSQGSHFFHNLTALHIGYLTVGEGVDDEARVDREWLDARPVVRETDLVRHIRLDAPLRIEMDGVAGRAVVLKPE